MGNICAALPFPRYGKYPHFVCVCEIRHSWERHVSSLHGDAVVEGQLFFKWPTRLSAPFRLTAADATVATCRISREAGSTCFAHCIAVNFLCLLTVFKGTAGEDLVTGS